MKKVFYLLVFLVGTLGNLSAQMVLFEGTFEEAEEKAKEEKKDLFVDFYADWCGPCKAMASEVFTRPEVGEYFNAHFICLQVNVEAKENANLAKTYRVIALPTMVFIRSGKELRRIEGVKAPEAFIKEAKIALGEELSFDQLYDKFKKDKKNFELQQQLLLDAPVFMSSLQGYDREKWASRIESLFPDYLKNKKLSSVFLTKEADVSFAVQQGEPVLLSILNKTLTSMPTTQFSGAVVSYNASSRKVTAKDFIQDNLLTVSLIVGISFFVVLCIILRSWKKSKRAEERFKKSAEQALKLNQELEEKRQELQNALVEAQSANKAYYSSISSSCRW